MKKIVLIVLFALAVACSVSKQSKQHEVKAVLIDNSELDGCGWMLELTEADAMGNKKLIPLNLQDFSVLLQTGKTVYISYNTEPKMNTCMAGATVRLLSLR